MKRIIQIVAGLFIVTGIIWVLQGINVLPGSFMTGQMKWAYAGILCWFVAGGLLWLAKTKL